MNIKRRRGKPISKQQVKRAAAREEAEWARLFTGSADGSDFYPEWPTALRFTTRISPTVENALTAALEQLYARLP